MSASTRAEPQVVRTGEPLWFLGTLVRFALTGEETGGRFALWEGVLPRGAAPPLHSHPQDETFYVLEGKVAVWVVEPEEVTASQWIETQARSCEPGVAVFVPGGTPHTFHVDSDTARMLFLSTPAGIEGFVRALAEPAAWPWLQPPPDGPRVPPERLEAAERTHDVIRLAPPPIRPKEGLMSMSTRAAVIVRAGEGKAVRWGPAGVMRILAGADSTDGSFSVCEAAEEPGSAAPLHVHHAEAEAFYVLEGEIELTCGEKTLTATAGDFAYTPRGVPHKYVVVGDRPARVLLFFSRPGFESFFVEGGTPLDQPPAGPPDPEAMRRLLDKYDLELFEGWEH